MHVRLSLTFFLIFITYISAHSQTPPIKKVKYFDDKIIKLDTLYYTQEDDCFTLRTQRDYRPLLEHLNRIWGHETKKKAHVMAYAIDSSSFPYWGNVKGVAAYPVVIEMMIDKDINSEYWDITFNIYDQDTMHKRQTLKAKPQLESLIKKYLISQKTILKFVTTPYPPNLEYQLGELVDINPDQIFNMFHAYIDSGFGTAFLQFKIDNTGRPNDIRYNYGKPVPLKFDSFINTLHFPVVIRKPIMDTLEYNVAWQPYIPSSAYKNQLIQHMVHTDSLMNVNDTLGDDANYEVYDESGISVGYYITGGKFLGLIGSPNDTIIYVCDKQADKWQIIDSIYSQKLGNFYLEDLDSDGRNELLIKTYPNMNGNQWADVFKYNVFQNKFTYAGDLSTEYTVHPDKKEIWIEYSGSWYMPEEKRVLVWKDNKLITKKHAVLSLKIADMVHNGHILKYYENASLKEGKENLILKQIIDFENCNDDMLKIWDDFFE